MDRLKQIRTVLRFSKSIAIFGHSTPDGDAICSALALKIWIEQNYKDRIVNVFFDGKVDEIYNPIINDTPINSANKKHFDLAIVVDCPNISRVGKYAKLLKHQKWIINIDHHLDNKMFGTININFTKASSTGEILYYLITQMSALISKEVPAEIIKYLYTAILTDTACFTSTTTTSRTHKVIAKMLDYNFDAENIRNYFFGNNPKSKTFLLQKALKSLRFFRNETISVMKLTQKDFESTDGDFSDSLGIINQGISIAGVKIAAIIIEKEQDNHYVSLRSKGDIDITTVAKAFNGGGHLNMAAFNYVGQAKDLTSELVKQCSALLDTLPPDTEENDFVF